MERRQRSHQRRPPRQPQRTSGPPQRTSGPPQRPVNTRWAMSTESFAPAPSFTLYVLEAGVASDAAAACSDALELAREAAPILRSTGATLNVRTIRRLDLKNSQVVDAMMAKRITGLPALLVSGTAYVGAQRIRDELQRTIESIEPPPKPEFARPHPSAEEPDDEPFLEAVDYDDHPSADNEMSLMSKLGYDD